MSKPIEIWSPRYKDDTCLIATYRVEDGDNYIFFSRAKHLEGNMYRCNSEVIRRCPTQPNGRTTVFIVPMSKLELVKGAEN